MELKEQFIKREERGIGNGVDNSKREIIELKNIATLQSKQIEELKESLLVLTNVFDKYDELTTKRIDELGQKAKELKIGSEELKNAMKNGVEEGIEKGTMRVIEDRIASTVGRVVENVQDRSIKQIEMLSYESGRKLREVNQEIDKVSNNIREISDNIGKRLLYNDLTGIILVITVILVVILSIFSAWQFRSLRIKTDERLYQMQKIQARLSNLTIGEGKYWYSEKDKQAYFGMIEDIKKAKEQEKAKKK